MENRAEKCLVERTGSCTGCNILHIVLEKGRWAEPVERVRLVERIRESLCPDGDKMIVPATEWGKHSIW